MNVKEAVMRGGPRHVPDRSGRAAGRGSGRKPGKTPPAETTGRPERPAGPPPEGAQIMKVPGPVMHSLGRDLESAKVTSAGRRRLLRIVVESDLGGSSDDAAQA